MEEEDRELAQRCQRGDPSAYERLYVLHAGRIGAYFRRSGFAPADAEDLMQETFTNAFTSVKTFDPERGSFGAWLAAIARNVARKHFSRRPRPDHFDPDLAEATFVAGDNPGLASQLREEIEAVRACVAALPEELAGIVRLRYVDGRTTRGIAAATGMPEATVRLRLAEARQSLQRCLREKGILE